MKRVSAMVIGMVLAAGLAASASARTEKLTSVLSTPMGITLQPLGVGQGLGIEFNASGGFLAAHKTAYGDAKGMTLYTYAKDEAGKSNCIGECTKSFLPAVAGKDAKAFGEWSLIKRDDGARQWAVKGKPLYTYVEDKIPGSVGGQMPGGRGYGRAYAADGAGGDMKKTAMSPEWQPAVYDPEADIPMPRGIGMDDIGDANGRGLVDGIGMTIYAFNGDANKDKAGCKTPCVSPWKPVVSPQLSLPVGDFTVVVRNDGINQWAYKGAALYTYEGDRAAHYANGIGVDKRFQVALVSHFYMPPDVKMTSTPGRGKVLANAQGLTLYRHDAVAYQTGGGHSLRRGVILRPGVGRQIGIKGCEFKCLEKWKPLLASANAQPSGYWETIDRPEGTKQWVYKGFPQWTYAGDTKPGDMYGNDTYDIAVSHDPNTKVDLGTPQVGAPGLYWLIQEP